MVRDGHLDGGDVGGVQGGVLVIGLGRFGSALAESLERAGADVLAVEKRSELVQQWAGRLTHVVQAEATDADALAQIGAGDFSVAVVAVGSDMESSILTTAALQDLGIRSIWAKAVTEAHGRILERVGAHHVVFPERDAGQRVAHLLTGSVADSIEFDDGTVLATVLAPRSSWDKPLAESGLRTRWGVTVVAVKRHGEALAYADVATRIEQGDVLLLAGTTEEVERFAGRAD